MMNLLLRRVYEGKDYTIGHLYVEGAYYCDTLEPPVRPLPARCPHTEKGYVCQCKEKVWGSTAIPRGEYPVAVMYSPKFRCRMIRLLKVPHFSGILLHQGISVKDTKGCILVGRNSVKGRLSDSLYTMRRLRSLLWKALDNDGRAQLRVEGPLVLTSSTGAAPVVFDPVRAMPSLSAFERHHRHRQRFFDNLRAGLPYNEPRFALG